MVVAWPWWVAGVVMGFLLHGEQGASVMEKKRTNSGPFRALTSKHSLSFKSWSAITNRLSLCITAESACSID